MPPDSPFRATAAVALAAMALPLACSSEMHSVRAENWGIVDGKPAQLYTLTNSRGAVCKITNYGATVTELWVPDRDGKSADVVLGFDTVQDYAEKSPYFGCIAGRCANRIAGGKFELEGKPYTLATNNGPNHLHGGIKGFDKVLWTNEKLSSDSKTGPSVALTYSSPDGEEGYPGNLDARVVYTLTHDNELVVEMTATTDATTVVNLAHHGYWNLAGHAAGAILDHELELRCTHYTPTDATLIPTGEVAEVAGTPFDFRQPKKIGADLAKLQAQANAGHGGGYDLNFAVDGGGTGAVIQVARLSDPGSGRVMTVLSDQPGLQLYTGNFLEGLQGKGGAVYPQFGGVCLETQRYPDAVHQPGFPPVVLQPGETYRHVMKHRFTTES